MNIRIELILVFTLVAACECGELIDFVSNKTDTVEYVSIRELLEMEPKNMYKLEPVFVTSIDYLNQDRMRNGLPPLNANFEKTKRVHVDTKLLKKYEKLTKHLKKQIRSLIGVIKWLMCTEKAWLTEKQLLTRLIKTQIGDQIESGGKRTSTQRKQPEKKHSRSNSIFNHVDLTTASSEY